jgi:hypothetical protein
MGSNPSSNIGGKTALTTHPPSFDNIKATNGKGRTNAKSFEGDGPDVEDGVFETHGLERD